MIEIAIDLDGRDGTVYLDHISLQFLKIYVMPVRVAAIVTVRNVINTAISQLDDFDSLWNTKLNPTIVGVGDSVVDVYFEVVLKPHLHHELSGFTIELHYNVVTIQFALK